MAAWGRSSGENDGQWSDAGHYFQEKQQDFSDKLYVKHEKKMFSVFVSYCGSSNWKKGISTYRTDHKSSCWWKKSGVESWHLTYLSDTQQGKQVTT